MDVGTVVNWVQLAIWVGGGVRYVLRYRRKPQAVGEVAVATARRDGILIAIIVVGLLVSGLSLYLNYARTKTPVEGDVRNSRISKLDYVWIPRGTFMMGCSPGDKECNCPAENQKCRIEEQPPHPVTIKRGFWVGQTEVTVRAYKHMLDLQDKHMPDPPTYDHSWADDNRPMVNVTWFDALQFCRWDNGLLPTEAQWEYAARGKGTVPRYGDIEDIAWYSGNSNGRAHEVKLKAPNWIGLYDTVGNVWEWVDDWYDASFYSNPDSAVDPHLERQLGKEGERDARVLRGGSFFNGPELNRLTDRAREIPETHLERIGFRCVQEY